MHASKLRPKLLRQLQEQELTSPMRRYKGEGVDKVDGKGTPDRNEFWGLSKDGILGTAGTSPPGSLPALVAAEHVVMERLIRGAHAICLLMSDFPSGG